MASADPRDPIYGQPYTGSPVQIGSKSGRKTVVDMYRLAAVTFNVSTNDHNRTPHEQNLYHE